MRVAGTITGDIRLWTGNDDVDARPGSVGGTVFGRGGNDRILMGAGVQRVEGGSGDDFLDGGAGADTLDGGWGRDELHGGSEGDTLGGGYDDDRLYGEGGDDFLRETDGLSDWLFGGDGNDSIELERNAYAFDPAGSFVVSGGVGNDRILVSTGYGNQSHVNLDAGEGADHITLGDVSGPAHVRLGGGPDTIFMDRVIESPLPGAIFLLDFAPGAGGDGIDLGNRTALRESFLGWDGSSDLFASGFLRLVQRGPDTWLEADMHGWGWTRLLVFVDSNAASFTAANFSGHAPVVFTPAVTVHQGTSGADSFQAGGDDLYFLNHAGDTVREPDGTTYDEVRSALAQLVLPDFVERLVLTGSAQQATGNWDDNVVTATDGADLLLFGQGGLDRIAARGGDDIIYFGAHLTSADMVDGGAGRDQLVLRGTYPTLTPLVLGLVKGIEEIVLLSSADTRFGADSGTPSRYVVMATDGLVPAGTVLEVDATSLRVGETLAFDGSAELDGRFHMVGGAGADSLIGGSGQDLIDGGAGADSMRGGTGGDTYWVDNAGDVIDERSDGGLDTVYVTLAAYSLLGTNLENLSAGSNAAHDLRGSAGNNVVTGGGGNDRLRLNDGGNDIARGGAGNDVLYFGTALGAGDVADGGDGRDSIVLQGNVTAVLTAANLVGIESISIQSGANTTFGDTANNFYDFSVTTADANVLAGQQLIVNAQSLRVGEDFTFNGSAESNGTFLVYGGHGVDVLKGGAGADVFFFEGGRWGANDRIDGGGGRDALVISAGSGLTRIEFAANAFTNIESISLNNLFAIDPAQKPSYQLVLNNGNVAAGATLIVNGSSIPYGQVVGIDGRAELDGNLILIGGGGNDTLRAGGGSDVLIGGGGADSLAGYGGADTFRYDAASDSVAGREDLIGDFKSGLDKIDLSRVDADTTTTGNQAFSWIGSNAFSNVAGQLRTYDSGGYRWIAGDTDGDGDGDIVIAFHAGAAPVGPGDFVF